MNLVSGAHIKYQVVYHLQWCPKYRYNAFRKDVYSYDYEWCVRTVAMWHGIQIIELSVLPDHIHAMVSAPPDMAPSKVG